MPDTLTTAPATDSMGRQMGGRMARSRRTHAAIVLACRSLMRAGDFRPTIAAVAKAANASTRNVFQHFGDVETLHREALNAETQDAVAALIVPLPSLIQSPLVRTNAAYAAVFGRPLHGNTE